MKPARVILVVLGSLIAVAGFGLLAGGAGLGWVLATQRDDAGYFTTSSERFGTDSYAITSDKIDLGEPGPDDWWADRDLATVRIRVENSREGDLFVGIGAESDVEAYLAGVPHDDITDVDFHPFSADYRRQNADGTSAPRPPADQTFWVAEASASSAPTVTWDLEPGRWVIVVMNADAAPVVGVDIELGGQIDYLVPIAIGLAVGGALLLACGAALIVGGTRRAPIEPAVDRDFTHSYPIRIEGRLEPNLSRWKWLVKWFLAIPHFVVLVFLWVAFAVLTIVAFFAILFTGRYPRRVFDFNVGVLRWTWRVSYYATSALGSDRYPPFALGAVDYPATLDIEYPEHLSRGLVLVKSWLLAIPHLLIVGILTATWTFGGGDNRGTFVIDGGLLGLLVAIAAISLLFTGRYPGGLFELVMGINRWTYRVIAYVALMTDRYPPFRLDQGGLEAETPVGASESPPAPDSQRPTVAPQLESEYGFGDEHPHAGGEP